MVIMMTDTFTVPHVMRVYLYLRHLAKPVIRDSTAVYLSQQLLARVLHASELRDEQASKLIAATLNVNMWTCRADKGALYQMISACLR